MQGIKVAGSTSFLPAISGPQISARARVMDAAFPSGSARR